MDRVCTCTAVDAAAWNSKATLAELEKSWVDWTGEGEEQDVPMYTKSMLSTREEENNNSGRIKKGRIAAGKKETEAGCGC